MSDILEGDTERILDGLDTVGNTTKAVTKGFAIGSAVIAAVALFASFRETIAEETGSAFEAIPINIADPKVFAAGLIGGTVVFLFASLAILAVSRTAGIVVQEVRRQFREKPGIMDYTEKPDYGPVIDICTGAALRELTTPALLAVLMPIVIGFGMGKFALGGYLAAIIVVGALMANFLSNAGGAWDNGKKYVEEGNLGGKGSDVHTAVVIGDTVGDPVQGHRRSRYQPAHQGDEPGFAAGASCHHPTRGQQPALRRGRSGARDPAGERHLLQVPGHLLR